MLTAEQNLRLTQVGPNMPQGQLLRRYWQPAALSVELGCDPIPVRLMGEDLVLFRDDRGEPALLGLHCSHRGADLSFGRLEDGGLRCLYHGWLFDREGRCLQQPAEPPGSSFKEKIRHTAYPCREQAGIIFAYLGPGDPPELPDYEFLQIPSDRYFVTKVLIEANFLQANEGNIDPSHLSFLHRQLTDDHLSAARSSVKSVFEQDQAPRIELMETNFGLRIATLREMADGRSYLRLSNFIMPNLSAFPGSSDDGYSVNWHVPIDDGCHWKYRIMFNRTKPLNLESIRAQEVLEVGPDFRLYRNRSNRYLQERSTLETQTFSGMGRMFAVQDAFATETPGVVQDRTAEHLGYGDKAIAASRRLLLQAMELMERGEDPPHVIRERANNRWEHLLVCSEILPEGVSWTEYLDR